MTDKLHFLARILFSLLLSALCIILHLSDFLFCFVLFYFESVFLPVACSLLHWEYLMCNTLAILPNGNILIQDSCIMKMHFNYGTFILILQLQQKMKSLTFFSVDVWNKIFPFSPHDAIIQCCKEYDFLKMKKKHCRLSVKMPISFASLFLI